MARVQTGAVPGRLVPAQHVFPPHLTSGTGRRTSAAEMVRNRAAAASRSARRAGCRTREQAVTGSLSIVTQSAIGRYFRASSMISSADAS